VNLKNGIARIKKMNPYTLTWEQSSLVTIGHLDLTKRLIGMQYKNKKYKENFEGIRALHQEAIKPSFVWHCIYPGVDR
jgi:hypothetical protein